MQNQDKSWIRDPSLAAEGAKKISWARTHMSVLNAVQAEMTESQQLAGLRVVLSIHLEAKTACLALSLAAAGAQVYATGSNPLSTQDDVCAALAAGGVTVYAMHGCTDDEYRAFLYRALEHKPHVVIDDGGDMLDILHEDHPEWAACLLGGCEETTTGIQRIRIREHAGTLRFPMINVNDADCKHLFDNRYGTGQSVWDGILRTTNLTVAGTRVCVCGYGWCGKGVAMRAKGLGARVYVTEVDPVRAIEAHMDGFTVLPMDEAAPICDQFITVTGCRDVITTRHMLMMKDGAMLSNAGHFDVEVDVKGLRAMAVERTEARRSIEGYRLVNGRTLYLLAEGRLVNLAAADGHPVEIMDMSFSLQALSVRYLKQHTPSAPALLPVPAEIDAAVARMKLEAVGARIDTLTDAQKAYIGV